MKKILITGGGGFIGSSIYEELHSEYDITTIGRDVDLLNESNVHEFLHDKYFDYVIHCAIQGGRIAKMDECMVLYNNLIMYYNIMKNSGQFGTFINIASGAEFDVTQDIDSVPDTNTSRYPTTPYGLSKDLISKCVSLVGGVNLRVFNVFGYKEKDNRMVKNSINKYINKQPIEIHQNLLMDFFYIGDLILVLREYLNNTPNLPKDMNLTYSDKRSLVDIANIVNTLSNHTVDINIHKEGMGKIYTGNNLFLGKLPLTLIGLEEGIKRTYKKCI